MNSLAVLCVTLFLCVSFAAARPKLLPKLPSSSIAAVNITTVQQAALFNLSEVVTLDVVVPPVGCTGLPQTSPYVTWNCVSQTGHGGLCSGLCAPGAVPGPQGSPLAKCLAGTYSVLRTCAPVGLRATTTPANLTAAAPSDGVGVLQTYCTGLPSLSPYVVWNCAAVNADGAVCAGVCVPGAVAPLGAPLAQCVGGNWTVQHRCMAGGVYGFDDVTVDGGMPSPFLGLKWRGLRVTNSQRYTACSGRNGFQYGVLSGPNVAYSLEIGAAQKVINYVSFSVPNAQTKMSVLSFYATPAWEDGLRLDVAAWDANGQQVALQIFTLSFFKPTLIDLRSDPRFSGIYSLSLMASGGAPGLTCAAGKQVVIDNLEVYLHTD